MKINTQFEFSEEFNIKKTNNIIDDNFARIRLKKYGNIDMKN